MVGVVAAIGMMAAFIAGIEIGIQVSKPKKNAAVDPNLAREWQNMFVYDGTQRGQVDEDE